MKTVSVSLGVKKNIKTMLCLRRLPLHLDVFLSSFFQANVGFSPSCDTSGFWMLSVLQLHLLFAGSGFLCHSPTSAQLFSYFSLLLAASKASRKCFAFCGCTSWAKDSDRMPDSDSSSEKADVTDDFQMQCLDFAMSINGFLIWV